MMVDHIMILIDATNPHKQDKVAPNNRKFKLSFGTTRSKEGKESTTTSNLMALPGGRLRLGVLHWATTVLQ